MSLTPDPIAQSPTSETAPAATRTLPRQHTAGSAAILLMFSSLASGVLALIRIKYVNILFGAGLAQVIRLTTPMPTYVAPWSIGVGVLIGAGVGIISGVYPASRASLLDPVAALRQE